MLSAEGRELLGLLGPARGGLAGEDLGAARAGRPANEVGRDGPRIGGRVGGQQQRREGGLAEIEVLGQVAQDRLVLADVGPGIWAPIGRGIKPGAAEEVVLDELQVGVAAVCLVVDVTPPGVGRDDHGRHTQADAVTYACPRWTPAGG